VDEETTARINELKDEAISASEEVSASIESGEDRRQLAAGNKVQELARRYAELLEDVVPGDRERVERLVGRRITDLRRQAEALTKRIAGSKAERARDAGFVPFLEQRAPPKSIEPPRAAPTRHSPKFAVGGEAEAWCGKCREFTVHHIVAMVGDQPKQVLCMRCKSRHSYRTEPTARGAAQAGPAQAPVQTEVYRPQVDPAAARRAEQKRLLIKELEEAVDPRPFDPRERYKANEIIYHPEHGRGKIENVNRNSLLVRFREGLRPLDLK
jgi:hypothetical protein